uniref:Uncharacterized protein n=1 Tax=Globisporangium ultimum (strain ATCC 200006 / CBS 805.95 / DAOM BR144) TaxID=431595 RepID=K3W594_GLOUD
MDKKVCALIDTGALLAGVLNNDAAVYMLELPDFAFAGVTYYDTHKQFDCWVVSDAVSKLVTPLSNLTILERETFVIFNDARSCGSDMKLDPNAVAVLTLGLKLMKDKFTLGTGQMRQLGCCQALWLVSLGKVAQKSEAIPGLLEWAARGLHFSKTQEDLEAELVEENWSLGSLYLSGRYPEAMMKIVWSKAHQLFGHDEELNELVSAICDRGNTFVLDEEILVA